MRTITPTIATTISLLGITTAFITFMWWTSPTTIHPSGKAFYTPDTLCTVEVYGTTEDEVEDLLLWCAEEFRKQ